LKWIGEEFTLPAIPATVVKASALSGGDAKFVQSSKLVEISLPEADHADLDTVIMLDLDALADTTPLSK